MQRYNPHSICRLNGFRDLTTLPMPTGQTLSSPLAKNQLYQKFGCESENYKSIIKDKLWVLSSFGFYEFHFCSFIFERFADEPKNCHKTS